LGITEPKKTMKTISGTKARKNQNARSSPYNLFFTMFAFLPLREESFYLLPFIFNS
jgi:hypothetical protein